MRKKFLKVIFILYIPLLIFSLIWSYQQRQSLIQNLAEIEQRDISKKSYHLVEQTRYLVETTKFWSNYSFPTAFSQKFQIDSTFIKDYIKTVQVYKSYDQFRIIDLHGKEIIRFEKIAKDSMVQQTDLQNKIDRGYFQKGLSLKKGQVYVSPIELNREYGIIENPNKPVIRGVTPVFDVNGDQIGLAVINFNMDERLKLMKTSLVDENFYLIDKNQNVITTNLSENTSPHLTEMNKIDSLIYNKLKLTNLIFKKDTFFLEKGSLWVYRNVDIGFEKNIGMNRYEDVSEIITDNDWAIIQETPNSYITSRLQTIKNNLILFNILTLIVIVVVALLYARMQKERTDFIAQLKSKNTALIVGKAEIETTNQHVKNINNKLRVRNQQLEDFYYVVAHNLKAPVSSMSIIVDMLRKSKNEKTTLELLPKLATISNSITTLTEDVLTYVSILNNKDLEVENVNLLLMLKDLENEMLATLEDNNAKDFNIIYKLDAWHSIKCSKFYMKSILQNLLSNAIKYRRQDVDSHIIFESTWENNQKVLYVKDNGLGIDLDKHKDNLFKLYKRFHRNYSGKGMGLFIVKSQLEAMNASIKAESEEGQGTLFKIKFNQL
ncbi:ATP-binding protein [Allomuricauda sp. F6463D]|uniref:sensor histidine kinase n=1 Tax=Allomuricauda sp. F6463D TaxID=2926409 RepID=UPI001FF4771F|nr:ATP-binding protein [Muricauda sp. F6463D]MCK0159989.1 sensor histidine kinase [Muricauda sp. F6463D]